MVDSDAEPQLRETLKALLQLLQELLSETRGLSNTVSSDYLVFLYCQAARGLEYRHVVMLMEEIMASREEALELELGVLRVLGPLLRTLSPISPSFAAS